MTVAAAIERYELHQRDRGLRTGTITTMLYRLSGMLAPVAGEAVAAVNGTRASETYRARVAAGVSPGTHRNELKAVRTFWRWCADQGWAIGNPWASVEPVGRIPRGKEQLRAGEAQRLHAVLLGALRGEDREEARRALGAGMALYLGMRATEIVTRQVRDVTEDGRYVELHKAKSRAGERGIEVPDFLAVVLAEMRAQAMAAGGIAARVLPFERGWPRAQAHRFCDAAGVPRVCAHALRGMHGSLGMQGGATAEAVARTLGHASTAVTLNHYVTPAAAATAQQRATLRVLEGGKR